MARLGFKGRLYLSLTVQKIEEQFFAKEIRHDDLAGSDKGIRAAEA
jgi:hypothetical protein